MVPVEFIADLTVVYYNIISALRQNASENFICYLIFLYEYISSRLHRTLTT